MVTILKELMAKIFLTHTNIIHRKFLENSSYTTKIVVLVAMYKMNMDNLNLIFCTIFFHNSSANIPNKFYMVGFQLNFNIKLTFTFLWKMTITNPSILTNGLHNKYHSNAHELNKKGCTRCHYYARPSLQSSIVGRLTPFLPCKGRVTAFNTNEPKHIFHKHLVTSDIP